MELLVAGAGLVQEEVEEGAAEELLTLVDLAAGGEDGFVESRGFGEAPALEDEDAGGGRFGDVFLKAFAVGGDEAVGLTDDDDAALSEEGEGREILEDGGE